MKKLNLDVIRLDGDTQPREKLDDERVDLYAENMKDGDKFPPIIVHHDGSNYWLSSGFHRYFATKKIGYASIECEVITGTLEDAQIYACGANAKSVLMPTAADNKRSVMRLMSLESSKNWTNAQIARHVGCSKMTVGRIKSSLEPKVQKAPADSKKTYTRKDGKEVTIDTSKLSTKKAKPVEPPEEDERDHKIAELIDTINELNTENQRLKDAIAVGQWDASEIEKIDVQDTLSELREQIRVLEIDNHALRDSRDMFQNRNAELMKTVKSLQAKLKKLDA